MKEKVLIMFVGKTHSGKTTVAQIVKDKYPEIMILEADPIAVFMKKEFPELRAMDDREHTGKFKEISLKFQIFLLFVEFVLSAGKTVLLSNSNMWEKGRERIFELCKKYGYTTVGVYFNYPEEELLSRIENSTRSLDVLRTSKDFHTLLVNQRDRMQPPNPEDFDDFFQITNAEDLQQIQQEMERLLG